MNDEFEVNVDDNSGAEVAAQIVGLRKMTLRGEFEKVDEMYNKWTARRGGEGNSSALTFKHVTRAEDEDDTDWDSESVVEDEDVDMAEAPALVKIPKEKVEPKVDAEGFTEVTSSSRKRR